MMRDLQGVVVGAVLTISLTVGNSAKANHETCGEYANKFIEEVKTSGAFFTKESWSYGKLGLVSPNYYDRCLIENFEKRIQGYTLKIEKKDSLWDGGTTYKIAKKPKN